MEILKNQLIFKKKKKPVLEKGGKAKAKANEVRQGWKNVHI